MTDLISALNESSKRVNILLDEVLASRKPDELYEAPGYLLPWGPYSSEIVPSENSPQHSWR